VPPLPVELTSFLPSVNGSRVVLKWQTATEVNNYGFEIQRSKAGILSSSFETIGFVNGNGKSNSTKSYSFTDQPTGGTSFSYRLKQMKKVKNLWKFGLNYYRKCLILTLGKS